MTPVLVRPVRDDDLDRWRPLWEGYNAFYGRSGPTELPVAITTTTWARFLDPDEPVHALVADTGTELVGLAHYLFHRSTVAIAPSCYLQDLFTTADARGKGVGRALIGAVRERAGGSARLYWQTRESNTTARVLYDAVAERTEFIVYAMALP